MTLYLGSSEINPTETKVIVVPYPGYTVTINNNDTAHQTVVAQLEPTWKTTEYIETFVAGAENVGVKLHLYAKPTASGYAHGAMSWSPNTFVNGGMLTSALIVNITDATPIEQVVIPTGYDDYYIYNSLNNFYVDTNYDTYVTKGANLSGNVIIFDLNNWIPSNNRSFNTIFSGCTELISLDLSNFDTSKVTSLDSMFNNCRMMTSLNVSNFNTIKVTSISSTFNGCSALTSLNVNNWNTSNVTSLSSAFSGCSALTSLNVNNWNTSNVTSLSSTFSSCSALTSLNVSNWNTSKVTTMSSTFSGCSALTSLNVSNWNTSKVTNINAIFQNCSSLTSLDLSNFDTYNVTQMYNFVNGCSSLKVLDVSNFDTTNTSSGMMFGIFGTNKLEYLIIGSNTFKFQAKTTFSLPSTCKILVPQALISTYQNATNWSTHSSKFDAIENYTITRSNGQVTVTPK